MDDADLHDPAVAADYDLVYADREAWAHRLERLMAAHLPVTPRAPLLDATCGTGIACQAAAQAGFVVTGADPSPAMLDIARERLRGLDVDLRTAELTELSDAFSRRFDFVVSIGNMLTALPPERRPHALSQLRAVCRDGGTLLVAVRDLRDRVGSRVWRDDAVARATARFVHEDSGVVRYLLDVEDERGRRSHRLTLHPVGPLQLAAEVEAAGFTVLRHGSEGGRTVVSAIASGDRGARRPHD